MDGFGGGWGRVQILRIMKDSRVGTYALVGTVLVQAVKLLSLAALPAPAVALPLAHCLSRWVPLPISFMCSYIQVRSCVLRAAMCAPWRGGALFCAVAPGRSSVCAAASMIGGGGRVDVWHCLSGSSPACPVPVCHT